MALHPYQQLVPRRSCGCTRTLFTHTIELAQDGSYPMVHPELPVMVCQFCDAAPMQTWLGKLYLPNPWPAPKEL